MSAFTVLLLMRISAVFSSLASTSVEKISAISSGSSSAGANFSGAMIFSS
jgi:hypothetical protein